MTVELIPLERAEYERLRAIRDAARAYIVAGIAEADAAAEWDGLLPGPKQRAARASLNRAYEQLLAALCTCDPEAYEVGPKGQRRHFEDRYCPIHGERLHV